MTLLASANMCMCITSNATCQLWSSWPLQRYARGFAHLAALGLVPMMLHYVIVKTVVLVGLIGMHKTGCSGETRLVLHVPHHELESIIIIDIVIIITMISNAAWYKSWS